MPTTETFASTVTAVGPSVVKRWRLLTGEGDAKKITGLEIKRVYTTITTEDGQTARVRNDEELVFQREVPTPEELESTRVMARLEQIRRFVAQGKASYDGACARVAEKRETGAHTMTSFDLDGLLQATAKGTVAARIEHAALLSEGLTDAQRVERVVDMCGDVINSFWGSQSTSNASNQLEWHTMAAWSELSRDVRRGW